MDATALYQDLKQILLVGQKNQYKQVPEKKMITKVLWFQARLNIN